MKSTSISKVHSGSETETWKSLNKLCQRINDLAQEYRKNTASIESMEDLLDNQEWFIEVWMQSAKEFKRSLKKKIDKHTEEINLLKIEIENQFGSDVYKTNTLENTNDRKLKDVLQLGSSYTKEIIQSKEFSGTTENFDPMQSEDTQNQDMMVSLKKRLLNEDMEQKMNDLNIENLEMNPPDGAKALNQNFFKNREADEFVNSQDELIDADEQEAELAKIIEHSRIMAQNRPDRLAEYSKGKDTPELYPRVDAENDSDEEPKLKEEERKSKEYIYEQPAPSLESAEPSNDQVEVIQYVDENNQVIDDPELIAQFEAQNKLHD